MKKALVVPAFLAMAVMLCATSFAGTEYVVTNDDNPNGNSATAYTLNTTTGALTQVKVLKTGGAGLGGGFFAAYGIGLSTGAKCVFVNDPGSNDIAAFAAPSYAKTGNYSNSQLNGSDYAGGSLALSPNGKFLYASYSGSENIGVWSVGAKCALTFVQAFVPTLGADLFGAIAITPNGKALVIGSDSFEAADLATINATTGELKDAGNVSFSSLSSCESDGCYPTGIDFTKDGTVAVFGNATISGPSALTANIGTSGLSSPAFWDLTNSAGVINVNVPFLTKSAYAGKGPVLFGASGYSSDGPSGVIVAEFVESPLSIKVVSSTLIPNADNYQFTVASTGSTVVTAEYPNVLDTFTLNANGSLTALKSVTDNQANGGVNFQIYPATR